MSEFKSDISFGFVKYISQSQRKTIEVMLKRIGILGGGQLGRMFIQEAINIDAEVAILDPNKNCPCSDICYQYIQGDFNNYNDVMSFGKLVDVITIEIEHVNTEALKELEAMGKEVYPQASVIELIKDKGLQKQFYAENNIPTSPFSLHNSIDTLPSDYPFIVKSRKGGYDGKGVAVIKSDQDLNNSIFSTPFMVEEKIDFLKELSVIVARNKKGEVVSYPMVEQQFNDEANLVEFLFSPAKVSSEIEAKGESIAKEIIKKLDMVGILAIEFFLTKEGELLVNEIAPRPHNSGHHTIEANVCSQFEQHLRSVLNLPLGDTQAKEAGVMLNLLGDKDYSGNVFYQGMEDVLSMSKTHVHLYGKKETKPFRKMGHITVTDKDLDTAIDKAKSIKNKIKVISK